MAIVFFEDFETSTANNWEINGANFNVIIAQMYGKCARWQTSSEFINYGKVYLPSSYTEGLVSFAFSVATASPSASQRIFSVMKNSTHQIGLYLNTDNSLSISRNTTLLYTSSPLISSATRYRVEIGFSISDASGSVRLVVNGVEICNLTGIDTMNTESDFNSVIFGPSRLTTYFDDILVDTDKTAFRGDFYGQYLVPTSDVSGYSTPSTGSNRWAVLDETPVGTSDYTTFPGTGLDRYGMSNLSDNPANIYGVVVKTTINKNDTMSCFMRPIIYSGTGVSSADPADIKFGNYTYLDFFDTDPNTGLPWTTSAINAIELGIERTA